MSSTTTIPKPVAPERSLVQRMEALQRANDIRSQRARLKHHIERTPRRAAELQVAALLAAPTPPIESMKAYDLLLATPKYGRVKVNKLLSRAGVSPSKTIGGLSQRQRQELAQILRG